MNDNTTDSELADVEQNFVDDIGNLAFEGALVEYLANRSLVEQEEFERYIEEHSGDEKFLDNLCDRYPMFEKILIAEMRSITDEFTALTTTSAEGNSQLEP